MHAFESSINNKAAERRRRSTNAKLELSIIDPETGMTRLMTERAEQREIDRRKQRVARQGLDAIEENVRRKLIVGPSIDPSVVAAASLPVSPSHLLTR